MKKNIFYFITLLAVTTLFLLAGCSKQDEEIRLLERITDANDDDNYLKFEYDKQNRLTSFTIYSGGEVHEAVTLSYSGNDLVGQVKVLSNRNIINEQYKKNGDSITVVGRDNVVYHLNSDGNIIRERENRFSTAEYTYDKNGNLIKKTDELFGRKDKDPIEYEYDNKKSPFTHCNTPQWWLTSVYQPSYRKSFMKNNVLKITKKGKVEIECTYEYDDAGYPIAQTVYEDGEQHVLYYKYKDISSINHSSSFKEDKTFEKKVEDIKKEDEICLIESITYDDGDEYTKYEYDDQNRINNMTTYNEGTFYSSIALTYEGNDLVGTSHFTDTRMNETEYEKEKNSIIATDSYYGSTVVYYLNNDGKIIKSEQENDGDTKTIEYTYDKNGNLIKETIGLDIKEYEYDNKKSPYTYDNTPKWWMQTIGFDTKNNVIKITKNGKVVSEYTYEYNNSGYPTKCTEYSNGKKVKTSTYKYKNAIQPISNSRK